MYSRSITYRLFNSNGDLFPLFAVFIAFVIAVLFVGIPIICVKVVKFYNKTYGNNEQGAITEDNSARIISKRTDFEKIGFPANQTFTVNRVTFELSNGSRIELAIKEPDIFGTMAEGDTGCLSHQGKKFIDFRRNV